MHLNVLNVGYILYYYTIEFIIFFLYEKDYKYERWDQTLTCLVQKWWKNFSCMFGIIAFDFLINLSKCLHPTLDIN